MTYSSINNFTFYAILSSCFILSETFFYPLHGCTTFWDWPTRLRQNDTTLQFHHFFWTTFTYLGPFFMLQLVIMLTPLLVRTKTLTLIATTLYLVEVQDYLFVNIFYSEVACNYWSFNLLLTNNLNKYHPHIFYASTWTLFYLFLYQLNLLNLKSMIFTAASVMRFSWDWAFRTNWINGLALFLGSWWAFQEGTWGGWWNWDPSEVLGLLVFLTTLLLLHKLPNYSTTLAFVQKTQVGTVCFVWVYFFTQLNFDLVSHNFGNRFAFFFVNTLFYVDVLILISLFLILSVWWRRVTYRSLRLSLLHRTQYIKSTAWLSLLTLFWALLVLGSFQPLFNYFLWQYLALNFLNKGFNYTLIYYPTLLLMWGVFTKIECIKKPPLTQVLALTLTWPLNLLTPGIGRKLSHLTLFHIFFTMSIALSIFDNQTNLTLISQRTDLGVNIFQRLEQGIVFNSWSVEDLWKEKAQHNLTLASWSTTQSFITMQSTTEVLQFSFHQNPTNFRATTCTFYGPNSLQRSYTYIYFSLFYEIVLVFVVLLVLWKLK